MMIFGVAQKLCNTTLITHMFTIELLKQGAYINGYKLFYFVVIISLTAIKSGELYKIKLSAMSDPSHITLTSDAISVLSISHARPL